MMRNIAGIMADEEPKTPISPSGLYNSSDLGSLPSDGSELSSLILNGRSELTLMTWMSVDDFSLLVGSTAIPFVELNFTSFPIQMESSSVSSLIRNSNGGITTVSHSDTYLEDTLYHVCVTQSLSNNRIRIYVNGVLLNSAVMSYNNATTATEFRIKNQDGVSLSQFNAYDRELTESEVAEHYVYDDDTMTSGVLGFDAMTPAQKSGLIYSSSYTDTISIAGNEFTDKSGNNITLSPQPSLTGQQIYIYTDANDLPNGGDVPVIYPVNSINWTVATGTGNRYQKTPIAPTSTSFAVSAWVKLEALGSYGNYYLTNHSTSSVCFSLYHEGANDKLHVYNGSNFAIAPTASVADEWFHIIGDFVGGSYLRLYINGVKVNENTTSIISSLPSGGTELCGFGYNPSGGNFHRGSMFQVIEFKNHGGLSQAEVDELYELKCFNNYSTTLYDKMSSGYNLGNYNGNTGSEATDQIGSDDLTAGGAMIFDETGLSVECGGTPTTPSNALPSNLPTIL